MNAFGVRVGDQAQAGHIGLALKNALVCEGPVGHIGLRKAGFDGTAGNAGDVGRQAIGRLRGDDDLAGLRHRIGNHAAHRAIGAGRAASAVSADSEELLRLRDGGAQGQHGAGAGGDDKAFEPVGSPTSGGASPSPAHRQPTASPSPRRKTQWRRSTKAKNPGGKT